MVLIARLRAWWQRFRAMPGHIQQLAQDSARLSAELARLEGEVARRIDESRQHLLRDLPPRAALLSFGLTASAKSQPLPVEPRVPMACSKAPAEMDQLWARLAQLKPALFPIWRELFENDTHAYAEDADASCSHMDSEYSRLFRAFVDLLAVGPTLDIGVGSLVDPYYLAGLPQENLAGIDPRPFEGGATRIRRFEGFCEFLPFGDETFSTVISGTSLDHVLDLPRSLKEIHRVLTRNGRALLWLASVPYSPSPLDSSEPFAPADRFHLFHFDRSWLDPLLTDHFVIADVVEIPQVGFNHVFYHLSRRESLR
jgi:SAM-dependent methyltransferase